MRRGKCSDVMTTATAWCAELMQLCVHAHDNAFWLQLTDIISSLRPLRVCRFFSEIRSTVMRARDGM